MANPLQPFFRRTQGIPFGERIMPQSVFADPERRGSSSVDYSLEQRGGTFWIKQAVIVTRPGQDDQVTITYFGPYYQKEECFKVMERMKKEADQIL